MLLSSSVKTAKYCIEKQISTFFTVIGMVRESLRARSSEAINEQCNKPEVEANTVRTAEFRVEG